MQESDTATTMEEVALLGTIFFIFFWLRESFGPDQIRHRMLLVSMLNTAIYRIEMIFDETMAVSNAQSFEQFVISSFYFQCFQNAH